MPEPAASPVDDYRRVIEELECSILPLATSVDWRQFTFQASLHGLTLQTGGYVVLERDGETSFGQILTLRPDTGQAQTGSERGPSQVPIRLVRGEGSILDGDGHTFHDALARPATPAEVDAWFVGVRPRRSALAIGDMLLAAGVPAVLDAGGFNRHTFMCGQSGSGKTYSLGLVLEQLLVATSLRMVILDPNLEERTIAPSLDTFLNVVKKDGGTVEKVDIWGKRRLAYEIDKHAEGIYAVIDVQAEPASVLELDRQLNLNESVLRTKVLRPEAR